MNSIKPVSVLPTLGVLLILVLSGCSSKADDPGSFFWSGAVTTESVVVRAKVELDSGRVRLAVSLSEDLSKPIFSEFAAADVAKSNRVVSLAVSGLQTDTQYYYAVEVDGVLGDEVGRFKTFAEGAFSYTIAFGACAGDKNGERGSGGSNHLVFDTIRGHEPLFYMNTGDLHYSDIGKNDPKLFREAYESLFTSQRQSRLYREYPFVYMWDDHDYGPNNSSGDSRSKPSSQRVYRQYVPHYPLAVKGDLGPIYQAFSAGRVRFILTDLRSEKSPRSMVDGKTKTMLGPVQKAWLKKELLDARDTHKLTVWVSGVPWVDADDPEDSDRWNGYAAERAELSNFIRKNNINNICMLSGDAHMLAIDDGSNNVYADGASKGFPVFHAAALDRTGSVKGGPYSHGTFPGGGQFGLMTVTDTGGPTVTVTWSGRNHEDVEIVSHKFTSPYELE